LAFQKSTHPEEVPDVWVEFSSKIPFVLTFPALMLCVFPDPIKKNRKTFSFFSRAIFAILVYLPCGPLENNEKHYKLLLQITK
jgi:hypothetical protein